MKSRDILILTQWFPPEHAPIGHMLFELAQHLQQEGRQVEVVTGFPNHPTGSVFPPYKKRWRMVELMAGMKVTRLWLFTSPKRSFLTRALNFLSFVLRSFAYLLFRKPPALVFAVLQPLPLGFTLVLLSKIKGFKLVFNVQDLHPDVMIDLGMIKSDTMKRALLGIERLAYRHADGLSVICPGFADHVNARGASGAVAVIPNWINVDEIRPMSPSGELLQKAGISQGAKVVLYAGTLGHVSGAGVALKAAQLARHRKDVFWLIVGEGPVLPELLAQATAMKLLQVRFLPFQPRAILAELQNSATVSMVTLLPGKGTFSVPSKVLGYMAAAKPVVASVDVDSETARLIHASACGSVVPAGDAESLWDALQDLLDSSTKAESLGSSGRVYLEAHFSQQVVCRQYSEFLDEVLGSKGTTA